MWRELFPELLASLWQGRGIIYEPPPRATTNAWTAISLSILLPNLCVISAGYLPGGHMALRNVTGWPKTSDTNEWWWWPLKALDQAVATATRLSTNHFKAHWPTWGHGPANVSIMPARRRKAFWRANGAYAYANHNSVHMDHGHDVGVDSSSSPAPARCILMSLLSP